MRLPDLIRHFSDRPAAYDPTIDERHRVKLVEARKHVRRLGDRIRTINGWQEDYLNRRAFFRARRAS